jgi:hypothetical protein
VAAPSFSDAQAARAARERAEAMTARRFMGLTESVYVLATNVNERMFPGPRKMSQMNPE